MEDFFWLAVAGDQAKGPVGDFLFAGEPFVRPRKENGAGESAFHHTVDMPAEHFGLFVLGMPDGIHAELAQNERPIFGQILQAQQVPLELALVVQVNVKA